MNGGARFRRIRSRVSDEAGLSLVELLVAMLIMIVILGAIYTIWFGLQRTYSFTDDDMTAQEQARAAMDEMVARCDLVLVGADSFSEEKLINKIGTKALTLVARQRQKPVYALATMPKFLPSFIAMPAEPEHGQNEVWANPPRNVRVVNHYFEQVAVDCFDGIITEEGIFDRGDLEKIVWGKSYHSALVSKLAELGKQSQGNPGIF